MLGKRPTLALDLSYKIRNKGAGKLAAVLGHAPHSCFDFVSTSQKSLREKVQVHQCIKGLKSM